MIHNIEKKYKVCFSIFKIIMAILVVFAVFSRNEVIEDIYPFTTYLGCFVMQFAYAFESCGVADIVVFIAMLYMLSYIEKNKIEYKKAGYVLGLIFSILYYFCLSFWLYNDIVLIKGSRFQLFISIIRILGYFILFSSCIRIILNYICKINFRSCNDDNKFNKQRWIKYALVIFVCWIPWMIMDFPGSFNIDSIDQLKSYFGVMPWTSHHPPLNTIIMGLLVSFGKTVNCPNIGVFLYIILQTILGALIFSYSIMKAYELGVSKKYCLYAILFFSVIPMWGCYIQWFEKSLLYTEFFALFTTYIVDIIYKKKCTIKQLIFVSIIGIVTALLRKNGLYCIIPTLIVLAFYLKKKDRAHIIISLIATLLVINFVNNTIYPAMGITSGSVAEAFSLPFQQTARYVRDFRDEVTPEEKSVLENTLAYDYLADLYNPVISDSVKSTFNTENADLKAYFATWMKMFFKHPNVYIYAYINGAYGYLAPVEANVGCNMDYGDDEWLQSIGIRHVFTEFPIKVFDMLETGSIKWPILKYFSMAGIYSWVLLVLICYIIIRKKYEKLIVMLPSLMTVLICTASPSANTFRYYQPVVACMPLLIAWVLNNKAECENGSSGI